MVRRYPTISLLLSILAFVACGEDGAAVQVQDMPAADQDADGVRVEEEPNEADSFDLDGAADADASESDALPDLELDPDLDDPELSLDSTEPGDADNWYDGDEPPVFTCLEDGTAALCRAEDCSSLGTCPLGCVEEDLACYVPSNVSAALLEPELGSLDLGLAGNWVYIYADTGGILANEGTVRMPGTGIDEETNTYFGIEDQGDGFSVNLFALHDLLLPRGTMVELIGTRPTVILASGQVTIGGQIDLGAHGEVPGPGGYQGGQAGLVGEGPGPGQPGERGAECVPFCASGGGGGGHGSPGGQGGRVTYTYGESGGGTAVGGTGGEANGVAELIPLVGGSGGAGGTWEEEGHADAPGAGGGGGGALQISAAESINIGRRGGITAPGDGGGDSISGGGAGGGAGGAILLEAPRLNVATGGYLTTNGGGGGGGDCT